MRNTDFRSGSRQARPPGFADRIEIQVRGGASATSRTQSRMSSAGQPTSRSSPPVRSNIAARAPRAALRSIAGPARTACRRPRPDWMFLNVRRRPFDSLRVRRALNYATDRARIVDSTADPRSQPNVPGRAEGFPGYKPYCPYTTEDRGGRVECARPRAPAACGPVGEAGARVIVWAPGSGATSAATITGLLDELGFEASLRVIRQRRLLAGHLGRDSRNADRLLRLGRRLRQPLDRHLLALHVPLLGSATPTSHVSAIADWSVRSTLRSPRTGAHAAAAWAAADRRVVDLAAVVPKTNGRESCCLQASRQLPASPPVVHAARPVVGSISRFQLVSRG